MKSLLNLWKIMKKANLVFLPILFGLIFLMPALAHGAPSASFKRMWIDYDVTEGGKKGMRIHTEFEVYNMKGIPGYLGLFMQYRNGTPLKDKNKAFYSSDGEVAVYVELNPAYNPTTWYEDLDVFMPYTEFDLPDGNYELQIQANVIYKQGGIIGELTNYDFVYNQGGKSVNKNPSATFTRAWVEYDVRENGRKGMRVHVKFSVSDMKETDGKLAIFFQKKNGDALYSNSSVFSMNVGPRDGEMVALYDIRPGYDKTDFADAYVFIPYSEFKSVLQSGTHNLQMDIDVLYANGDLLQHLSIEPFWFEYN